MTFVTVIQRNVRDGGLVEAGVGRVGSEVSRVRSMCEGEEDIT